MAVSETPTDDGAHPVVQPAFLLGGGKPEFRIHRQVAFRRHGVRHDDAALVLVVAAEPGRMGHQTDPGDGLDALQITDGQRLDHRYLVDSHEPVDACQIAVCFEAVFDGGQQSIEQECDRNGKQSEDGARRPAPQVAQEKRYEPEHWNSRGLVCRCGSIVQIDTIRIRHRTERRAADPRTRESQSRLLAQIEGLVRSILDSRQGTVPDPLGARGRADARHRVSGHCHRGKF